MIEQERGTLSMTLLEVGEGRHTSQVGKLCQAYSFTLIRPKAGKLCSFSEAIHF